MQVPGDTSPYPPVGPGNFRLPLNTVSRTRGTFIPTPPYFHSGRYDLTTRAAIYARISDAGEQPILVNQLHNLRGYCADRGFDLEESDVFQEVASGRLEKQGRLNDLLSEASKRTRSFDLVVFTSLSRMSRGGVEAALYILHRLETSGVGWHIIEQPSLNFDSGTQPLVKDILLGVLSAIDKDYRARITVATKGAYQKRKALAEARGEKVRWGRPKGSKNRPKNGDPSGRPRTKSDTEIAPISQEAAL